MTIHSSGQNTTTLSYIEGITQDAGEDKYQVAGKESGVGLQGICEVGDRVNERQAILYVWAGFFFSGG